MVVLRYVLDSGAVGDLVELVGAALAVRMCRRGTLSVLGDRCARLGLLGIFQRLVMEVEGEFLLFKAIALCTVRVFWLSIFQITLVPTIAFFVLA